MNATSFNQSSITIYNYDLFPGWGFRIRSRILTPFNNTIYSGNFTLLVPNIASGKYYCGACQLNDKSLCAQLNDVCWVYYMNYTITSPFNTSDCLAAMAPICYNIWKVNGTSDYQCLDFIYSFNYNLMKLKPKISSGTYSTDGQSILITFSSDISCSRIPDATSIFDSVTLNWLPADHTMTCPYTNTIQVAYDPRKGYVNNLNFLPNSIYSSYTYAQEPMDSVSLPVIYNKVIIN